MNVLLIEDETLFAKSVSRRLEREAFIVRIASNISDGKRLLSKLTPDIVLLDVNLPDGSGLDLLSEIRQDKDVELQQVPILIMTAYGELDDAVQAMKLGASDYLKKPVDLDELQLKLKHILSSQKVVTQLQHAQRRDQYRHDHVEMLGQSSRVLALREQLQRIVQLIDRSSDTHPVVLIQGDTGTGKDVAARLYHQLGSWRNEPFIHVDCASLPSELIEAELFGYERGAFTHAHQAKSGLIEVAEGGTVFLDEVGELPLALQVKLLNVLERRVVRRLGSTKEIPTNAHFVAATNRDLEEMVESGLFRADLYFRLNILELHLPRLADRPEDIIILVNHYLAKIMRRYGLVNLQVDPDAMKAMESYSWPGNIRELQHVLERAAMLSNGVISVNDLGLKQVSPFPGNDPSPAALPYDYENMTLEQVEKDLISKSLQRTTGNVSRSARELGLTRMAMRYRMEKYKL